MKQRIIDCSKPKGHPERERIIDLPKTDIAYLMSPKEPDKTEES